MLKKRKSKKCDAIPTNWKVVKRGAISYNLDSSCDFDMIRICIDRSKWEDMSEPILKIRGMSKHFGLTVALNKVDLDVYPGEIRGLIGENGSGKSTITSIAAGMQPATEGTMEFKGAAWKPHSMTYALEHGIGMVVQEQGTIGGISIAENIFLGNMDKFTTGFFVSRKKLYKAAKEVLALVGMEHINPALPTQCLDLQERKLVEIAKVISKDPDIFVVDETTTALSQDGRRRVYEIMKEQKAKGKTVLFISHDLDELMETCDTLTVLRDGNLIKNLTKEEFEENAIKQLMVGRELKGDYYRSDYDGSYDDEVVLEIVNGNYGTKLKNMNLKLHRGEILGIGGLSDCGMHDLGKALFGAIKLQKGVVRTGRRAVIKSERIAMKHKIGYVSKDRDVEALNMDASITDNISVAGLHIVRGHSLITKRKESRYVKKQIDSLSIKCREARQSVAELSGGNKQKVVFGKWIGCGSEILILDCPTRGVDIGVKQAMYQLIYQMKKEGKSIIIISEELAELIGMCDRLLIMKDGAISGEVTRNESVNESSVIGYMI